MHLLKKILPKRFHLSRRGSDGEELQSYWSLSAWLWQTWKGYRLQAIINASIGTLLVLADLAFVYATKVAVDISTNVRNDMPLRTAIWMLGGIVCLQLLLGIASRWVRATLGVRAQNSMQRSMFERLMRCRWKDLKRFHTGDLLNRIERDVFDVIGFLTESIPAFLTTIVQFTGAFVFLFLMDKSLAIIVVLILPFFFLSSKLYVKKMRHLTHKVRSSESRIQAIIQESLQHTLVIKTLEHFSVTLSKLTGQQRQLAGHIITKTKYSTISSGLMNLGFAAGYLIAFTWGTVSLHRGLITYGALIAFVQLVAQIQGPVRQLTHFIPVFIGSFTATERLMELESVPLEREESEKPLIGAAGIEVRNLTCGYTPKAPKIFRDFSYNFPPGSITAILGETGSGKTTLIRLLLSLISAEEGSIRLYDDKGNSYWTSPGTRCNFSYVPQGNTLLSGTIRSNLLMAAPDASEYQLREALRLSAANFVDTLPQGLDTPCGEMGDGLSEGQAQRVAIARALLKDAPFLLLDEATSALDSETERQVIYNIIDRFKGRTIIFVTHRMEALRYATQTLTLEKRRKKPDE